MNSEQFQPYPRFFIHIDGDLCGPDQSSVLRADSGSSTTRVYFDGEQQPSRLTLDDRDFVAMREITFETAQQLLNKRRLQK